MWTFSKLKGDTERHLLSYRYLWWVALCAPIPHIYPIKKNCISVKVIGEFVEGMATLIAQAVFRFRFSDGVGYKPLTYSHRILTAVAFSFPGQKNGRLLGRGVKNKLVGHK